MRRSPAAPQLVLACTARTFLGRTALIWAIGTLLLAATTAVAQDVAVSGRVLDRGGDAVTDAVVRLVDLGRSVEVDGEGRFFFPAVPPGRYVLETVSARSGRDLRRVTVVAGTPLDITVHVDPFFEGEPLIVTARPSAALRAELVQAADVLEGPELRTRRGTTLGETLSRQPGVSSSYFGPGAGRPIIRGFGGDRIQILEHGLTVADASGTSPDHAVSIEPSAANRIEIVRGPATLLYGSSAVGGVVNVEDGRIPLELPRRAVQGAIEGWAASVSDELAGQAVLTGRRGRLAWHASAMHRDAGDLRIPAEPGHDHDDEGAAARTLEDSAVETSRGAVGLSFIDRWGHIGIAWTGFRSEYGIPGHGHASGENDHDFDQGHGHAGSGSVLDRSERGHEDGVSVDMIQRRFDAETVVRLARGVLRELRGRFAFSNYDHAELEDGSVSTRIDNRQWNTRVEARHRRLGPFAGAIGVQLGHRDLTASGEEAFVPPTDLTDLGIFVYEGVRAGDLGIQLGTRYDRRRARTRGQEMNRNLDGISLSGGANWRASEVLTLALSMSRSIKLPSAEELFSDGPHLATGAFEVGDPALAEERALTLDGAVRIRAGPLQAELTGFAHRFEDFIFQEFTAERREGLPVLRYAQANALFTGIEGSTQIDLVHAGDRHLALSVVTDHVRAELRGTGEPLPRIPPLRISGAVDIAYGPVSGEVSLRRIARQNRVGVEEEPTEGHVMLDASARYRIAAGGAVHEIVLVATNLTDEFARSHVSFLRDRAPLPGRNFRLLYRLSF